MGDDAGIYGHGIAGAANIFKYCDDNFLRITIPAVSGTATVINGITYTGTAVNGTHYTRPDGSSLPTSVTVPAGSLYVDIPFKATPAAVAGSYFNVAIPCPCGGGIISNTHTVHIYNNDIMISSVSSVSPCPSNNTGQLIVNASNGSGLYEYSLDGLTWQTTNVFTGLAAGDYTVRARDIGGCEISTQLVNLTTLSSNAGADLKQCDPVFTMNGRQPATTAGETGIWTIVGASTGISIASPQQYNTTVTLNLSQTQTATLRWTVSNGQCSAYDDVTLRYEPCSLPVNPHIRAGFRQ
jgi:hypothetical protein